jgi:hypothetical protein
VLKYQTTYSDLKEEYIRATSGFAICKRIGNNRMIERFTKHWESETSFHGPASSQVIEWLHNGYPQPGLSLDPPIEPLRKRRRAQFGDEGELHIDLALSGYDYPFMNWGQRVIMPGMQVFIFQNFNVSTSATVISQYSRWILRAIIALETAGIDVEIKVCSKSSGMLQTSRELVQTEIEVKKSGEQSDFLSWSPMLSPASFRHLSFLADVLAADALNYNISEDMGHARNEIPRWSVLFDPDTRDLTFTCPNSDYKFPEEEMDLQLREILNNSRKVA